MKSMQKLIALGLMVFFSINLLSAQKGDKNMTPEDRAQKRTERMTQKLALTADQAAKIGAIHLEVAREVKAIKESTTDREAGKKAVKALRTEASTAIKALLTPEQLTKYEEGEKRRRGGKMGKSGKGHGGTATERAAKKTEKMTEHLGLTPEQSRKIATINLSFAQKMETAKSADISKENARAAHKELRAESDKAIKAVLTTEQLAKFSERGSRRTGKKCRGEQGENGSSKT